MPGPSGDHEQRPAWPTLPAELRTAIGIRLGGQVTGASIAVGGYGPSMTYRVQVGDSVGAFVKCVGPTSTDFVRQSFATELRVYRECAEAIAGWSPTLLGTVEQHHWQALILEDLGELATRPWTPRTVATVAGELARWHHATSALVLPGFLRGPALWLADDLDADPAGLAGLVEATSPRPSGAAAARASVHELLAGLADASGALLRPGAGDGLVHGDLRSDNLTLRDGRLVLFDWPAARRGSPAYDLAFLAQAVTVEGGPEPEDLVGAYGAVGQVDSESLDGAVALAAHFFLSRGWAPALPGLPRLRDFQRAQARVSLAWAQRRLGLALPQWAAELVDSALPTLGPPLATTVGSHSAGADLGHPDVARST